MDFARIRPGHLRELRVTGFPLEFDPRQGLAGNCPAIVVLCCHDLISFLDPREAVLSRYGPGERLGLTDPVLDVSGCIDQFAYARHGEPLELGRAELGKEPLRQLTLRGGSVENYRLGIAGPSGRGADLRGLSGRVGLKEQVDLKPRIDLSLDPLDERKEFLIMGCQHKAFTR